MPGSIWGRRSWPLSTDRAERVEEFLGDPYREVTRGLTERIEGIVSRRSTKQRRAATRRNLELYPVAALCDWCGKSSSRLGYYLVGVGRGTYTKCTYTACRFNLLYVYSPRGEHDPARRELGLSREFAYRDWHCLGPALPEDVRTWLAAGHQLTSEYLDPLALEAARDLLVESQGRSPYS